MHTGILLAVEAENAESAVGHVENWSEHNAPWSDWNEHGGRWMDVIPNGVISYTDNPSLFIETVNKFRDMTNHEVKTLLHDLNGKSITEIALDPKYQFMTGYGVKDDETEEERDQRIHDSLTLYRAKKLLEVVGGEFTKDQHFFDIEYGTATDAKLQERIESNPSQQFIVVWDYHH